MLNAVHMAARAWTSVSRKTVMNCFKKALGTPKLAESINTDDFLNEVPIPQNMSADVFYNRSLEVFDTLHAFSCTAYLVTPLDLVTFF